MAAGGKRIGAGRKSKVEEQKLIERLSPLMPKAFKALEHAISDKESWAVKMAFEYFFGKAKETKDIHIKELPSITISYATTETDDSGKEDIIT